MPGSISAREDSANERTGSEPLRRYLRLRLATFVGTCTAWMPANRVFPETPPSGRPSAVDSSGTYRGKYQFDTQTWASVGGTGDPAAAPEAEQDRRAAMLYAREGSTPWPVCGR